MSEFLLDTCSVIWLANGDPIHPKATERLNANCREGQYTYASPFSAWELGILVSRSRLRLERPVLRWFEDFLDKGQITLAALSLPVLVESSFLPGTAPGDTADRMIIPTARAMILTILTRDRLILNYSKEGHVRAMKC